ncbi:MAG TPA: asparaginase [Acidothermaceae bacterium]|nr:asparaginase [Acidothermaceae bacterium]
MGLADGRPIVLTNVAVFALGGTIASSAEPGGAAVVGLSGAELLNTVPGVTAVADVEVFTVAMVPSGDLRLHHLFELRDQIAQAILSGTQGVVVTQGTDTLEETAYAFELLTSFDEPVVFTAAMRSSDALSADGPANLMAAVRVAASPDARSLGVLVVLNDEIHSATDVRKMHTSSTAAFASPLVGPVGYLTEGRVRVLRMPVGRITIDVPRDAQDARVALVTVGFDDDDALIGAVAELGYDGLVVAAFGGGHVPSWLVPAIERVAGQLPTVLASRTAGGEVLRHSYGYAGSETDLLARGLISAVGLSATKARILLRLLLVAGVQRDEVARCFEEAVEPAIGTDRSFP